MGFGSADNPYVENPFAGRIVNVHWPAPTVGAVDTLEVVDSELTVHTNSLLFFHRDTSRGLYVGARNPTVDRTLTYSISMEQILNVFTEEYVSGSWSGTLAPGQTFLVAVWQPSQLALISPAPDVLYERLEFLVGGEYVHGFIDITATASYPP